MKLLTTIVLFTLLITHLHGQVITGIVIDSSNSEPLEYVSIGVIGTSISAMTDKDGNFKIDVTGQSLNAIIRISMISYKPQTFTIEELRNKENTIKLIQAPIQLGEVAVSPSGEIKDVGSITANTKMSTGWFGSFKYGNGYEVGLKIQLGAVPVKLLRLHFNINQTFDTTVFRLHVRNIVHRKPADDLLSSNIFSTVTKSSGMVDIDLSNYNIVLKGDIALLFECVRVAGIHKSTKPIKTRVAFLTNKQGTTYFRRGYENKWLKINGSSPCIYLTVQELI
jgi:hypothetical protein